MKRLVIALIVGLLCIMTLTSISGIATNVNASVAYIEIPPPIVCTQGIGELAYIEVPPPIVCTQGIGELAYIEVPPPIVCVIGTGELV